MKKYLVIGGTIRSKSDGDIHYISPRDLCRLYNVSPAECVMLSDGADRNICGWRGTKLEILSPSQNGYYPDKSKEAA